ncbi:MAG: hypothetical protein R2830_04405 [Saprospiraceae bacterium]
MCGADSLAVELLELEVVDPDIQVLAIEYQAVVPTADAGLTSLGGPLPHLQGIVPFQPFNPHEHAAFLDADDTSLIYCRNNSGRATSALFN